MGRSVARFFRRTSQSTRSLFSKELDTFYINSLVKDLKQLDQSLSDGSISLQWSVEAMKILKKIQVEQLTLLKNFTVTISHGAHEDGWVNQYMQDSIAMLDFCNSLKFSVARMSRYCMMVELIIENQAVSSKTIKFDEKLVSESQKYLCVKMMRETIRLGCRVQAKRKGKENKGITAAMLAAKRTMVVVSVLLVSAIVSPVSIELGSSDLHCRFPQLKPFVDILSILLCRFQERAFAALKSSGFMLYEHEIVGRMIVDLQAQVDKEVKDRDI
ncbi:hypothetical protein M5K25_022740 [Dendrobium thyrsiflorum]|uniref:Uncharacterized protein n=1 Tax=Dendrobium thyrsiflorum TaxID=117978 RepID=A0ABD0U781_DENTH